MPELPEVETTLLGLKPHILGQQIAHVTLRHHQLRWPIPANLPQLLKDQVIQTLQRRGKYILIGLEKGTLLIHLGMSGRLSLVPLRTPPAKHDHIDIHLHSRLLRYTDPRRFGAFLWVDTPIFEHSLLKQLGLEPFDVHFNGAYLWEKAQKKKQPIKAFIMDQYIVVGVGNIYATEALFMTQIHPLTPAQDISLQQMQRLVEAIQTILKYAIEAGGTSLKDFLQTDGKPGYFKLQLQIYNRHGKRCLRCQTLIEKIVIAQRASTFCPKCQPMQN